MRKEGKHRDDAWVRTAYLDHGLTISDIARECAVDPGVIVRRLDALGIPHRSRWARKPFWTKDWLWREYIDNQRSPLDIANQFGLDANAIYYWIKKHKIPTRTMSESAYVRHARLREELDRSGKERT